MNKEEYSDNDIQVLEGLEAVRKRPGMYIGTTSERGLHHLVWEIVDNSVDEALAGFCDDIEVIIEKDNSIVVKDDGRGMPTGTNAKTGLSTIETIFTVLHAGGKFGGGGYTVSGGLHGVGASVVNALSEWLEVYVYQHGKIHYQRFEHGGKPVEPMKVVGECDENRTGTTVKFKPDNTIFTETTEFKYEILYNRLQELAFLNKGLRIILSDVRDTSALKKDEFLYNGGIIEYVRLLNKNKTPIHQDIVYFEGKEDDISIEIALQYNSSFSPAIYSFTNNIKTYEGGTHEDGVKRALTRVINNYAKSKNILKEKDEPLIGDDVREGITMIISCKHPNPQFEGQTKTKLGNAEVRKIADDIFSKGFERFLMENPAEAKIIVEKAILSSRGRIAAKRARESVQRKSGIENTEFAGKLVDCKEKDPSICEIFIVEGNSAGGSAVKGRNSLTQAILPLRGKILNVEKARLDRALGNEEIRTIITAFGTGIGQDFDINKLRYNKIIIMADADVDGEHIRVLLLTLFYRFFRPLIEQGHVYAAQPPLFCIKHGQTIKYVLSDEDKEAYLKTLNEKTKFEVTRMKGLGEMDSEELNETTMDINKRILRKITIDDAIKADATFSKLMSEEVGPRRQFIEENAVYVQNLDV